MEPSRTIRPLIDALNRRLQSDDAGLTAAIDLAVLVASADGKVDDIEQAALATSLEGLLASQLDPAIVRHLVRESRNAIQEIGPEVRAKAIGELLAAHDAVDEGLRLALAIGIVSDGLSSVERERIAGVARAAGVDVTRLDTLARSIEHVSGVTP